MISPLSRRRKAAGQTIVEFADVALLGRGPDEGPGQNGPRLPLGAEPVLSMPIPQGRPQRLTFADGRCVEFQYDEGGRLVKIVYPDQTEVGYRYDEDGLLVAVVEHRGIVQYQYDLLGRLTGLRYPDGSAFAYRWDGQSGEPGLS